MPPPVNEEQISILHKFIIFIYYPKPVGAADLDIQRMCDIEHSTHNNFRLIPPSKIGFIQHVKRSSYEAGLVACQYRRDVDLP